MIQNHNQCKQSQQQIIQMRALARMEALNAGYDEAIMLNNKGHVAEGSAENIFVVKKWKKITTPPLDADILNGITRDSAIKLLKSNKIKVIEKKYQN